MRRRGTVQLLGDRCNRRRKRHLEIVTAAPEVDDVGIMSVAKDPVEEPVAEALTVTTEQLERLPSQCRRGDNTITLHHRSGRTLHEVECFISRQALTTATDVIFGMGDGGWRMGDRRNARCRFRRARHFSLTIRSGTRSLRPDLSVAYRSFADLSFPNLSVADYFPDLSVALATTATSTTTAASTAVTHQVIALTVA